MLNFSFTIQLKLHNPNISRTSMKESTIVLYMGQTTQNHIMFANESDNKGTQKNCTMPLYQSYHVLL